MCWRQTFFCNTVRGAFDGDVTGNGGRGGKPGVARRLVVVVVRAVACQAASRGRIRGRSATDVHV